MHCSASDGTARTSNQLAAAAGSHTNLVDRAADRSGIYGLGLLLIASMWHAMRRSPFFVVVSDALISDPTVVDALILAVPLGASIAVIEIRLRFGYGLKSGSCGSPAAFAGDPLVICESALANGASGWHVLRSRSLCRNISAGIGCATVISAGTAVLAESASLISYRCAVRWCRAGAFSGPLRQTPSTCSQ